MLEATKTAGFTTPTNTRSFVRRCINAVKHSPALSSLILISLIDLAWIFNTSLTFTGWQFPFLSSVLLLVVSAFYRIIRPVAPLSELACYGAGWVALGIVGSVSTYLASSAGQPLQDAAFSSFDLRAGFDWVAWARFVRAHPVLNTTLRFAYGSLMPQVVGSLILFALAKVPGRNHELLLAASISLLITSLVSALLPALGPWVYYDQIPFMQEDIAYVPHVLALRQSGPLSFALGEMQGIVCFPSYHTTVAFLFVYAHRGLRWSFPLMVVLNVLMLLSIPSEGGHYLSDMIASVPVALLSIGIAHLACRPASEQLETTFH